MDSQVWRLLQAPERPVWESAERRRCIRYHESGDKASMGKTVMAERGRTCETLGLIARLRIVLTRTDMDCGCREVLSSALERFSDLEARRLSRRLLLCACDHKDRIAAILALLSELNQLTENETDRTVFEEMALLFDEIGRSAVAGAAALRDIDPPKVNCPRDELPCAVSMIRR